MSLRNPVLALPAVERLLTLPPALRNHLYDLLMQLRADAQERADKSWARHKGPMAAYWKAVAVYAGHIARAIRPPKTERKRQIEPVDPERVAGAYEVPNQHEYRYRDTAFSPTVEFVAVRVCAVCGWPEGEHRARGRLCPEQTR